MLALFAAPQYANTESDPLLNSLHDDVCTWFDNMDTMHFSYTHQRLLPVSSKYAGADCVFYMRDDAYSLECAPISMPPLEDNRYQTEYFRVVFRDGATYSYEKPLDPYQQNIMNASKKRRYIRLLHTGAYFIFGKGYSEDSVRTLLEHSPIALAEEGDGFVLSYWVPREKPTIRPCGMDIFLDARRRIQKIVLANRACCTVEELRQLAQAPVHHYGFLGTVIEFGQYEIVNGIPFPTMINRTMYEAVDRTKALYLRKMYYEEHSISLCEMNLRELLELEFAPTEQEIILIDADSISFDGNFGEDVFNPEPKEARYVFMDLDAGHGNEVGRVEPWLTQYSSYLVLFSAFALLLLGDVFYRLCLMRALPTS